MNKIRNYEELISCGDAASRKLVLELTDRVLKRLDSYDRIKDMMSMGIFYMWATDFGI